MTCLDSFLKCKTPSALESAVDYLRKKGRLELWSGVVGIKSLERAGNEQALNREAESAYVRRNVWKEASGRAEAMHDTYLGDVTHVHNTEKRTGGGLVKALIGAGLLASGAGAGVGGMLIADALRDAAGKAVQQPAPADTDTDTQYKLRLGKPE